MLKHQPKTLAKTLDYIIRRSPGEYGLFWDPDGTMPWKDFYWSLQEDPSLRFVREASIRELMLLGVEIPFILDGSLLRLRPEYGPMVYEPATDPPARLYFGVRPKNLEHTQKVGLNASRRSFVPLCGDRDFAIKIAKRRDDDPVLLEIPTREAIQRGVTFLAAGGDLYLVESVAAELIAFPKLRQDLAERLAQPVKNPKIQPSPSQTPGSFIVEPKHFGLPGAAKSSEKGGKSSRARWKREGRKERHKRDI